MPDPAPDPLLDPRLAGLVSGLAGRYEFLRQLGEGGMAVVLLARDLQHDRLVAFKVLRPELTPALGGERFHQEIRLTAKVQHPHIVAIFDSGETAGHLWYTMPCIEGESLRQRLTREEQLPVPDAIRIILQACRALEAAHEVGVIHRDIKPENLLISPAGDVFVVDFGVARGVDSASLTRTGIAVGTPQYMSPEQASGKTEVNARSDVYTLGCVLYEMLAGDPPFDSRTPQAISAKHLNAPVPDVRIVRETVSPALHEVIKTALAKSPADRYANAGALADAIEKALASPQTAWWKARPVAAVLAAVVVTLALGFGVMLAGRGSPTRAPTHKNPPTIGVLYFENARGDTALSEVADAITEALIGEFTGAAAFNVVSRFGVRQFRDGKTPIDAMRQRLAADYWIAGEVRRSGSQLMVQAQLIDAITNIILDSASVPLTGGSTAELATDAAIGVANGLKQGLNRQLIPARSHDSSAVTEANRLEAEAESYWKQAEDYALLPNKEGTASAITSLDRADRLLGKAIEADPRWLRPWISRARVGVDRGMLEDSGQPRLAVTERALAFADSAMRIAPNNAEALELRGTLRYRTNRANNSGDTLALRLAENDLRDAVGRDSLRAGAWATLGEMLWLTGRLEESDAASSRAMRLDPFIKSGYEIRRSLFSVNLTMGRFGRAEDWCRRMRAALPTDWFSRQCELTLLRHDVSRRPDPARAWRLVAMLDTLDPEDKAKEAGHSYTPVYRRLLAATVDARAGNRFKAESVLAEARKRAAGDSTMQLDMAPDEAVLLYTLGRRAESRRVADRFWAMRPTQMEAARRDPLYRVIVPPAARSGTAPQ